MLQLPEIKTMKQLGVLAVMIVLGCSIRDGAFQQVKGRELSPGVTDKITNGTTTIHQLMDLCGTPEEILSTSAGRRLRYYSVRERRSVRRVLLWQRVYCQSIDQSLTVDVAHSGIVTAHKYEEHVSDECAHDRPR